MKLATVENQDHYFRLFAVLFFFVIENYFPFSLSLSLSLSLNPLSIYLFTSLSFFWIVIRLPSITNDSSTRVILAPRARQASRSH